MVIQKRLIAIFLVLIFILSACQPAVEREPVTQPWQEQQSTVIPTETAMPAIVSMPTSIPEIVLAEPADQAFTPTPFVINEQTTSNQYSMTDENHVYGLYGFPPDWNPLTGQRVENPAILNRRPVLTKISNFPVTGRPHAGLSYADVVFEYYIGEYTNRFLALYYGQDASKAWPLRSGRLIDPN